MHSTSFQRSDSYLFGARSSRLSYDFYQVLCLVKVPLFHIIQRQLGVSFLPWVWVAQKIKIWLMINLPPYPNFVFVFILVTYYKSVLNWQNLIIFQSKRRMKMFEIMTNYIFNCIAGLDLNFLRLCLLSCQKFVSPNSYLP